MNEHLENLIHEKITRRKALKSAAFLTLGAILPRQLFNLKFTNLGELSTVKMLFKPIESSDKDKLVLPEGFNYTIIRKWGDKISDTEYFGYNNDFVTFIPIDFLKGGKSSTDGLMHVNHEYPLPLFVSGYTYEDHKQNKPKTKEQIELERKSVGLSIFRVKFIDGKWQFVSDNKYNRRVDANSKVLLSGKAASSPEVKNAVEARGTLGNCSGGVTPWGTVISAEENYQDYPDPNIYRWLDGGEEFINEHYGWLVEYDPFDKNFIPVKKTSLGRFRHENLAIQIAKDGRVVAYSGDDKINECVYKFISKNKFNAAKREANFNLLDDGNLFAADFANNTWRLLDYENVNILKENFKSQADILVNCEKAAKLVGATECNRPEDIEINPVDKTIFVSFTNNITKQDYHGSIVRIIEKDGDHTSTEFTWKVFATGGVDAGFSCPDNLYFDSKGNLWTLCDVSSHELNKGMYTTFKNNALFMIPTVGKNKGQTLRFASGPVDTEMCGTGFTPDESTMFLSIQHPGETSLTIDNPTSRWPDFGNELPKPAVVAITGFKK